MGGCGRGGWTAAGPGVGRTTARLLGLPLVDDDDPATRARDWQHDDVAVPPAVHLRQQPTLHVRRLALVRGDRVRIAGCPSVSLTRALPTLAAVLSYEALVCLLDAALHRRLLDEPSLEQVLTRHRGQPNVTGLRAAVAAADGRAESPAETLARLVLLPVLPELDLQVRLQDGSGRVVARFDLADPRIRLAVEADGRRGHSGDRMVARDQRRDRTARSLGWVTERCTWWELRREQGALRQRIAATAARLEGRRAA